MIEEILANGYLRDSQRAINSDTARFRREWANTQKVEHLETELQLERLRRGDEQGSMNDVWRKLPV